MKQRHDGGIEGAVGQFTEAARPGEYIQQRLWCIAQYPFSIEHRNRTVLIVGGELVGERPIFTNAVSMAVWALSSWSVTTITLTMVPISGRLSLMVRVCRHGMIPK
jgi:hypothetical protein